MNSSKSLIFGHEEPEEETPQQRAQRILNESITFRTSLVTSIHKEIHLMCWEGWITHCDQVALCKSRTDPSHLGNIKGTAVNIGPGQFRYMTHNTRN